MSRNVDDFVCSDPRVHVLVRDLDVFRYGNDTSVSGRSEKWLDVDSSE